MKKVRTIADLERLIEMGNITTECFSALESEFLYWYEAEGNGESLTDFQLSNESCIHLLEEEEDTKFLQDQLLSIEFVEKEKVKDCVFFRVGIMNDHEMNIAYFLEGTLDPEFEERLQQ